MSEAWNNVSNSFKGAMLDTAAEILLNLEKGFIKNLGEQVASALSGNGFDLTSLIPRNTSASIIDAGTAVGTAGDAGTAVGTAGATAGTAGATAGTAGATAGGTGSTAIGTVATIYAGYKLAEYITSLKGLPGQAKVIGQFAGIIDTYMEGKNWYTDEDHLRQVIGNMMRQYVARGGYDSPQKIFDGINKVQSLYAYHFNKETGEREQQKFHTGGVIPGIIGQERLINALSGEEVLTRNDPRHSTNIGSGMVVTVTGNNINSMLDVETIAKRTGDIIMRKLALQTNFKR